MRKERESNYDLLRIVSTVAVITIHVSGFYVKRFWKTSFPHILYLFSPCRNLVNRRKGGFGCVWYRQFI